MDTNCTGKKQQKKNKQISAAADEKLPNTKFQGFVCNQLGTKNKISASIFLMDKKIFTKTYRLIKSDNYDAFLKEAGASLSRRRLEQKERPTMQLRQQGNEYILKVASEHRTETLRFRPSERFVVQGYDGKNVQTVVSFENGNTLVEMQMGQKPVTILREFFDNGVVEMMMCEKTVCCRVYSSSE